jgi:hypothetical protein
MIFWSGRLGEWAVSQWILSEVRLRAASPPLLALESRGLRAIKLQANRLLYWIQSRHVVNQYYAEAIESILRSLIVTILMVLFPIIVLFPIMLIM